MGKPTIAELTEQLTEMTNRATAAEDRVGVLTKDLDDAKLRAADEVRARQEAERKVDVLEEEKRQLGNQLRAYKGSATKAREQVTILKAELSPEIRPIGAIKPARTEEDALARAGALEAAFAMGPTTIVFSDGRREIREIAPLIVDGNAWREIIYLGKAARELDHDPILEVVGEKVQVELAGFGLLNAAGDQVGYCALPSPLPIARGQHMRLPKGTIRF